MRKVSFGDVLITGSIADAGLPPRNPNAFENGIWIAVRAGAKS
jgi:hypothetical protein